MKALISIKVGLALLLLNQVQAIASECTYRVSRDFRNLQSDVYRGNAATGDAVALLSETEDTLVRENYKTGTLEPGLAQTWEYDEENKRFIFTLNQSCSWSDGTQLTAADFVYGFRQLYSRGASPKVGGHLIAGAEVIIEQGAELEKLQVEAISNDKLSVGIEGDPNIALLYLTYIAFSPLPSHVFNAEYIPLVSPKRLSIGPYRVESVDKDAIALDKNPYYCSNERIDVERVEVYNRKQGYWEFSQLMAGKLDMVRYTPDKQLQVLNNSSGKKLLGRVELIDEQRQTYLLLNPLHEGFANKEIRQKLISAIDYRSVVSRGNLFVDVRKIAKTLFYDLPNFENHAYSADFGNYEKGVDELRNTMEKYGYRSDAPLKANIITFPLERFETTAQMISSMLRRAHFDIRFIKEQSSSDILKLARAGRFDMIFWSWALDYSDPQSSLDGLKGGLDHLLAEASSDAQRSTLKNDFVKPFNELLVRLNKSLNQEDRLKLLQEVEKLIVESSIVIPLYTEYSPIVVSKRVSELNGQFPNSRSISLSGCTQASSIQ